MGQIRACVQNKVALRFLDVNHSALELINTQNMTLGLTLIPLNDTLTHLFAQLNSLYDRDCSCLDERAVVLPALTRYRFVSAYISAASIVRL